MDSADKYLRGTDFDLGGIEMLTKMMKNAKKSQKINLNFLN